MIIEYNDMMINIDIIINFHKSSFFFFKISPKTQNYENTQKKAQ